MGNGFPDRFQPSMEMFIMNKLANVKLSQIRVNPVALREVDPEGQQFKELLGSIRSQGVLSSVSLRYKPGDDGKDYELIDGLQRFTAALQIGTGVVDAERKGVFETVTSDGGETRQVGLIPANIVERNDEDTLYAQIITNTQRVETKPVEYARGLRRLLGFNPTMTESELAVKLSKSPTWISKQLGLLKLADNIKPLVNEGKVNLSNAYVLAKLPAEEQIQWLTRAQTESPEVFGPAALERVKAIRDANRQGREAGEIQFSPVAHMRKKTDLEGEIKSLSNLRSIANSSNALSGIKPDAEGVKAAFERGAALALQWTLNLDPVSVEAQRKSFEEKKQRDADLKARREAEKKAKQDKEAADKTAKAATKS